RTPPPMPMEAVTSEVIAAAMISALKSAGESPAGISRSRRVCIREPWKRKPAAWPCGAGLSSAHYRKPLRLFRRALSTGTGLLFAQQLTQYVVQDATGLEVLDFIQRVDAAQHFMLVEAAILAADFQE